jgi:hypothetical protein
MLLGYHHHFDDDEARARVAALTDYWSTRYAMKGAWQGGAYHIAGKTKGIRFDATFIVTPGRVEVQVKVPFFARRIGREYVDRKLADYLDPGKTIAELRARLEG